MSDAQITASVDPYKGKTQIDFLSQHMIAVIFEYETVEANGTVSGSHVYVLSGWLIELHDRLFWVTAGHCLDKINEPLRKNQIRILRCRFMDNLGYKARFKEPVWFTYELNSGFYIWEPEEGLDFAVIPLNGLYRQAILKNDNLPITREKWIHQHRLSFDFFRILGIPEDRVFTKRRDDGTHEIQIQPTIMAVNQITFDEAIAAKTKPLPKSHEWFFGRLDPGTGTQMVEGMSGGPIYGFRKLPDGQLSYHVVALQSWWDAKRRIVFGCSVPLFAEWLHREFQAFYDRQLTKTS